MQIVNLRPVEMHSIFSCMDSQRSCILVPRAIEPPGSMMMSHLASSGKAPPGTHSVPHAGRGRCGQDGIEKISRTRGVRDQKTNQP